VCWVGNSQKYLPHPRPIPRPTSQIFLKNRLIQTSFLVRSTKIFLIKYIILILNERGSTAKTITAKTITAKTITAKTL
jgi:hypothetical protein